MELFELTTNPHKIAAEMVAIRPDFQDISDDMVCLREVNKDCMPTHPLHLPSKNLLLE